MGKFALLCQASRLLGQVLNELSNPSVDGDESWLQLYRTLQAMLAASLDVESPDYDQITIVYSALTALCTPWLPSAHTQASKPDSERSRCANFFLQQLIARIDANLIGVECMISRDHESIPPWGLFFAYRVCVTQSRLSSKNTEVSNALRTFLTQIDSRWNIAGNMISPSGERRGASAN